MVMIKDEWKIARIVELHPGEDGIVQTVTIKTVTGIYKRALKNLYPLPIE